jgi:hypothetical protein
VLPPIRPYSKEIAQGVAASRGLSITAVEFASLWLKTVVFAQVYGQPSWILTDASGCCSEARRIDRKPFYATETLAERKSHSLAGSNKSWPVGILPGGFEKDWLRQHVHKILLVEGGPDYLAACQIVVEQDVNILPIAMLGASQSIAENALAYFSGRKVAIVAHADDAGVGAGKRWAQRIIAAGGAVVRTAALLEGDLNDAVAAGATHKDFNLFPE